MEINSEMFTMSIQLEYACNIFSTKYLFLDIGEAACILCMTFKVLGHLRADVLAELLEENIRGFLWTLNIDPFEPGDPREFFAFLSETNTQLTAAYELGFMQEGNRCNL